ncbi:MULTISPECIES: hypothetical protein [unclassified Streptomyces]|uniref:hypothetical protein n=1 Tax=unclassified Streptomyces TaxID=2593676 RepID=UPI001EF878C9|nr:MULTISPECIES: hypothetical protein [unclassified Streptomyces]
MLARHRESAVGGVDREHVHRLVAAAADDLGLQAVPLQQPPHHLREPGRRSPVYSPGVGAELCLPGTAAAFEPGLPRLPAGRTLLLAQQALGFRLPDPREPQ